MLTQAQVNIIATRRSHGEAIRAVLKSMGFNPDTAIRWLTEKRKGKLLRPAMVNQLKAAKR